MRRGFLFMFLTLAVNATAQLIDHTQIYTGHIDRFYTMMEMEGVNVNRHDVHVYIAYLKMPAANGRINVMPDGTIRIVIDKAYYEYFRNSNTVYHLIFKLMVMQEFGVLMRGDKVYRPLKKYEIKHIVNQIKSKQRTP